MVLLALAAGAIARKVDGFTPAFAAGTVIFMALNALAALYPLYRFRGRGNPFNIYLAGMVVRMAVIGVVLIAIILGTGLGQNALLAIALTGMGSFVAYLCVEIHHLLRHNASLLGTR